MTDQLPILVALDDRQDLRAVDFAAELAAAVGSGVRVLSVVANADQAGDRKSLLQRSLADRNGVSLEVRVVVDDAVDSAIIAAAGAASTVCMTTAATLLPHEGHFGSIAESVVRTLGRSVILLGPKAAGRLEPSPRMVVPVDGSELGEYVIGDAARLAAAMSAEVWVVTVVGTEEERSVAAVAGPDYGALESGYVRRVARTITSESGAEAQFEVLHGPDPATAVLDFAGTDAIIAMSTHGRSGLDRVFAGSVTRQVIAGAKQPVMVLRPPRQVLSAD